MVMKQPITFGRSQRVNAIPSPLSIRQERTYGTYDDAAVEALAVEEGLAAIGDPSVHGEDNNSLRSGELVVEAGAVNDALIGSKLIRDLEETQTSLEHDEQAYRQREDVAIAAVDDVDVAEERRAAIEDDIVAERGSPPDPKAHRGLTLRLLAYGIGDLLFIALVFQVFGLSDDELIPHVPISELELAAGATIFALLYLAHAAGCALRDLQHHLFGDCTLRPSTRRSDGNAKWRLTVDSAVALAQVLLCVAGATGLLVGISVVRASYLLQLGVDPQWMAFLGVQGGIFVAAVITSFRHAHPHERDWRRALKAVENAHVRQESTHESAFELAGHHDAQVQRRRTMLGDAWCHLQANGADTRRQVLLAARRRQLSLPEPVMAPLHPHGLPTPAESPLVSELHDYLTGLATTTAFAQYERLDTSALEARLRELHQHRAERRDRSREVVNRRRAAATGVGSIQTLSADAASGASSVNGSKP